MEFRLIYQGKLPSPNSNNRVKLKHVIRKELHRQLKELWQVHPFFTTIRGARGDPEGKSILKISKLGEYSFTPIIGGPFGQACALDILFLRRDQPGGVIRYGGDIDNRIKVLFDALKVPQQESELPNESPAADEYPLFCLLEDDSLITEVKITTDRLLIPAITDGHRNDVHLIIHVRKVSIDGF